MDWGKFWEIAWPIVRQGLIALLISLLGLLGYDRLVPSRSVRAGKAPALKGRSKEGEG